MAGSADINFGRRHVLIALCYILLTDRARTGYTTDRSHAISMIPTMFTVVFFSSLVNAVRLCIWSDMTCQRVRGSGG